jgi:hypothetical protein
MKERNYANYSAEHHAAAKAFMGSRGTCSYDVALYHTQSTLPKAIRIQDDLELLYPHRVAVLDTKFSLRPRHRGCIYNNQTLAPTFIWDISGGQYPRGKAFRKLIKRELQAQQFKAACDSDITTPYLRHPAEEGIGVWLEKNMRPQGAANGHN